MPETATRFAHEAVSAAGYSFDAHHEIATTPDAAARLERHLMDPVASISSEDRIAICLIDLIAHFAYTVRRRTPVPIHVWVLAADDLLAPPTSHS
jgi:hypothetical protein